MSIEPESEETAETLGFRVDTEFKRQVRMAAAKQNVTVSEYLRETVGDAVEQDL